MQLHGIEFPSHKLFAVENISEAPSDDLLDSYFTHLYDFFMQNINMTSASLPHIDINLVLHEVDRLLQTLSNEQELKLRLLKVRGKATSKTDWVKSKERSALMKFFWIYPQFANTVKNFHLYAHVSIRAVEAYLGEQISTHNFVQAKAYIDRINTQKWDREQTRDERQSGVSNLGGISELLLEKALDDLIDSTNFFKTNDPKVKSYGDFILMCLPNNLWISVKSNFARERLLASGYTTDIIGVGFFTDKKEFTSKSKIRNFQRVGFLAMYLPNIPITDDQIANGTTTYQEVVNHFGGVEALPRNINGTSFIRSLSELNSDLSNLLSVCDISSRTTIDF